MSAKKQKFLDDYEKCGGHIAYMILIKRLPTNTLELSVITQNIEDQLAYYISAYDDQMHLLSNPLIKIEEWFFVKDIK